MSYFTILLINSFLLIIFVVVKIHNRVVQNFFAFANHITTNIRHGTPFLKQKSGRFFLAQVYAGFWWNPICRWNTSLISSKYEIKLLKGYATPFLSYYLLLLVSWSELYLESSRTEHLWSSSFARRVNGYFPQKALKYMFDWLFITPLMVGRTYDFMPKIAPWYFFFFSVQRSGSFCLYWP